MIKKALKRFLDVDKLESQMNEMEQRVRLWKFRSWRQRIKRPQCSASLVDSRSGLQKS